MTRDNKVIADATCCCGIEQCCVFCDDGTMRRFIFLEFFGTMSVNGSWGGDPCDNCNDFVIIPIGVFAGADFIIDNVPSCDTDSIICCNWVFNRDDEPNSFNCGWQDFFWLVKLLRWQGEESVNCAFDPRFTGIGTSHTVVANDCSAFVTFSNVDTCQNGCCLDGFMTATFFN